jgi:4'-phosphopantetheinyl transferase
VIDVWVAGVPVWSEAERLAGLLLAGAERERVGRFRSRVDAARFVAGRALAQLAVAPLVGAVAGSVVFDRTCRRCGSATHGPPRVVGADVVFSVSRSRGVVLCAVGAPGADVEWSGTEVDVEALAGLVLSAGERAQLDGVASAADRRVALLTGWVRKEAYLKGTGVGLADGMAGCEVTFLPGDAPAVVAPPGWWLADVPVADYVAAVAAPAPGDAVAVRDAGDLDPALAW